MKKTKFIIFLIIMLPVLHLITTPKPNLNPSYNPLKSKYDNLESAFLDYAEILYNKETITIETIMKDLTGFDTPKTDLSEVYFLDFEYENKVLNTSFVGNALHNLTLETNINNVNKSMQFTPYNTDAYITSSSINTHKTLLNSIDSSFDIEFVESNKETIDSYVFLLETLENNGYLTLENCRNALNLKLNTVTDIVDMTGSKKFGYWKIYNEKDYTITTFNDVVIDIFLILNDNKSGVNYSIFLGTNNDFIHSDENKVNTFVTKPDIDELLNSSYSTNTSIFISPDYDEIHKIPIKEFYALYDLIDSVK